MLSFDFQLQTFCRFTTRILFCIDLYGGFSKPIFLTSGKKHLVWCIRWNNFCGVFYCRRHGRIDRLYVCSNRKMGKCRRLQIELKCNFNPMNAIALYNRLERTKKKISWSRLQILQIKDYGLKRLKSNWVEVCAPFLLALCCRNSLFSFLLVAVPPFA